MDLIRPVSSNRRSWQTPPDLQLPACKLPESYSFSHRVTLRRGLQLLWCLGSATGAGGAVLSSPHGSLHWAESSWCHFTGENGSLSAGASAVEAFVAPLRAAAPPSPDPAGLGQRVVLWRLFFNLLASTEPARPELSLEWLSQHWPWMEAALGCQSESACEAAVTLLTSVLSRTRNIEASQSVLLQAFPVLAQSAAERGSAAALQGVVNVTELPHNSFFDLLLWTLVGTRMFRGGATTDAANFLAQHILAIARRLLPSLAKAQDLPPDLLAALLEAFTVALAPRCKLLASQLMASPEILAALLQPVCGLLCNCASPRLACWSLMLLDRFPAWLQHAETAASARKLLEISLPWACEAFLSLLSSAPVVRDTEVSQTLAQALISIHRAMGSSFTASMARGLSGLGLQEEGGFLLQQLEDSGLTEECSRGKTLRRSWFWSLPFLPLSKVHQETLAEALRDAADAWQAAIVLVQRLAEAHFGTTSSRFLTMRG
eukprot:s202_g18.t1